jgi:mRNA interferase MazF
MTTMICEPFCVVDIPFPFSDLPRSKRRKALVLSDEMFQRRNRATIMMMITSATGSTWHLDVPLVRWEAAGLKKPCVARAKLFTLDNRLIIAQVGLLAAEDADSVKNTIHQALAI